MMAILSRILGLVGVLLLTVVLLYASRFWEPRLWGNDGLFGIGALRPQGDVVDRQLRDLPQGQIRNTLVPLSLVIWGIGSIWLLSLLHSLGQRLHDLIARLRHRRHRNHPQP